jgi:hypothetical protein
MFIKIVVVYVVLCALIYIGSVLAMLWNGRHK